MSGTDINILLQYSARKLKSAEANMKNGETKFAAYSINNKGNRFSLADECVQLLCIGQEDGIKSDGEKTKREKMLEEFNIESDGLIY